MIFASSSLTLTPFSASKVQDCKQMTLLCNLVRLATASSPIPHGVGAMARHTSLTTLVINWERFLILSLLPKNKLDKKQRNWFKMPLLEEQKLQINWRQKNKWTKTRKEKTTIKRRLLLKSLNRRKPIHWLMVEMRIGTQSRIKLIVFKRSRININRDRISHINKIGKIEGINSRMHRTKNNHQLEIRTYQDKQRRRSQRKLNSHLIITSQTGWGNSDAILERMLLILQTSSIFQMVNSPNKTLIDSHSSNQFSKKTSENVVKFKFSIQSGTAARERSQRLWKPMMDIHLMRASMMTQSWAS